jgi:sensor histidine kinase YesM
MYKQLIINTLYNFYMSYVPMCFKKKQPINYPLLYQSFKFEMKNLLNKIHLNRYFLLFIMLFAYVQSIHVRISAMEEIDAYTFTPEAVLFTLFQSGVLFVIILFFIKKWQKSDVFSTEEMLKIFGSSLMMYLIAMKLSGLLIAFLFGNIERNFNQQTFFFTLFSDFLNGFIYGSFFLAYYYYNKNKNHHEQLANYHQALNESKIHQLKAQLNPHFLFNNLNVLDQLIEEDKHKASDFLNEFAEIYRYVLQVSDKKLISLNEELAFAEQYFRLIQHKYGHAYQLNIEHNYDNGYIVPLTLQLLIENAVQHNLGTKENPVIITINVGENICTSNNINLKRNVKTTNGRALSNLKEQYKLLTKKPIEIEQSDNTFSVIIPIIPTSEI